MRRLDIDPEMVALVPKEPEEILTRCLSNNSLFPRERMLSFAACSNQPAAVALTSAVRKIKAADLAKMSFGALCVFARVNPMELLGAVMAAAINMKAVESKMKAAMAHPEVVDATIKTAKKKGAEGFADRKMLHEAVGFLPTRKGGGIEINFGFGRPAEEREEDSDADASWDETFPELGGEIQQFSAEKHKLLEGSLKER